MSAIYFTAFLTNQKENALQYLTEKIIVSMEKFMLPREMLYIIVFCKAQHNAEHMLKKPPNLNLYMLINVMLIKKTRTANGFVALPRLHATVVDCAHELTNKESGIKGEAGKILQSH